MFAASTIALPSLRGQEIPRPSETRHLQEPAAPPPANLKLGAVSFVVRADYTTEFVDNVYLSKNNPISDFILHPDIALGMVWPLTERNTLQLSTAFGYSKYLENPRLDEETLTIAPDSALRLFIYSGDFRLELHDSFSIEHDTSQNGSLGGVASLPRFTNTVGAELLWDLSAIKLTVGADHYNFITIGNAVTDAQTQIADPSVLDHTTDQLSAEATLILGWGSVALESTVSYSNYPDQSSADFTSITIGPAINWQVTKYTKVSVSAGYKRYLYPNATQPVIGIDHNGFLTLTEKPVDESPDGFYASLGIDHRLNRYYTDRLEIGHEDQVDALSGRTEDNYLRYSFSYLMDSKFTITGSFSLEDVRASQSNLLFAQPVDNYRQFIMDLGTSYKLTPHVNLTLDYGYTARLGEDASRNYRQNRVTFGFGYTF